MKKQFFRILSCCVLLACLCALPAYAQEPKAAQPAAKEDKVVTDVTGSADLMRNVVGFTTNFGGPYHFAQADHKSLRRPTVMPLPREPLQYCGFLPAPMTTAMFPSTPADTVSSPSPMSRSRISMWADCSLRRIRPSP